MCFFVSFMGSGESLCVSLCVCIITGGKPFHLLHSNGVSGAWILVLHDFLRL